MAIFEVLFPLFLLSGVATLTFFGVKSFLKNKEKRIAKRQQKREQKQEKREQKQAIKQQKFERKLEKPSRLENLKAFFGKKDMPRQQFASGVNCIHTVDNYDLIYQNKKGKKYSALKAKQGTFLKVLEDESTQNKPKIIKKVNKINKKLEHTAKTPIYKQKVDPDYIKEIVLNDGTILKNKKTFIQCFDESLAEEFRAVAEQEMAGETKRPNVAQINFNAKSNLAPLIISAESQKVFEKGLRLINQKMLETVQSLDETERQNAFPIMLRQVINDFNRNVQIKNENDLTKFFGSEKAETNIQEK
ncbi:MAG: hypothetical protein PHQ62_01730 [Clostridia bacterium]|nr:hypothetical protein [Clostridia bacterium]